LSWRGRTLVEQLTRHLMLYPQAASLEALMAAFLES